jgi:hypothetical protein
MISNIQLNFALTLGANKDSTSFFVLVIVLYVNNAFAMSFATLNYLGLNFKGHRCFI